MGSPLEGERGSPVRGRTGDTGNALRRCIAYPGASMPPGRVDRKRRKDGLAGAPLSPREKRREGSKDPGRGAGNTGGRGDPAKKGIGLVDVDFSAHGKNYQLAFS